MMKIALFSSNQIFRSFLVIVLVAVSNSFYVQAMYIVFVDT